MMIELYMLVQLVAIADNETMSKAAEALHLSQPALSRTINKIEEILQVKIFDRGRNRITLNENGLLAVEYARKILSDSEDMIERIRAFELNNRTISVTSCAPSPLWTILPMLTELYPNMKISSEMVYHEDMAADLLNGSSHIVITNEELYHSDIICRRLFDEQLFLSVPPAHPLSGYSKISFSDLDGETMLLYSDLGYWHEVCKKKTPNTKYIVQNEFEAMNELVKASALPCYVTNISKSMRPATNNRIDIPIIDDEAKTEFFVCWRKEESKRFMSLGNWLDNRN